MSTIKPIITELREKRLLPIVGLLVVALVAIPMLLMNSGSSSTTPASPSASVPPPSLATALPAVSVTAAPQRPLRGRSRNPFEQIGGTAIHSVTVSASKATATAAAAGSSSTSSSGSSSSSGNSTSSSSGSSGSSTNSSSGSSGGSSGGGSPIPVKPVKPAPSGLSSTQSYNVTLAITNPSGGLNTIDPLERLSVLPSNRQPLLVELGVLRGGKQVLFAVQPNAVVNGPGTCTPGPVDCEILSLGQEQVETLGMRTATGDVSVASFAVTGISAAQHASVAAAQKARRQASAAGRLIINHSTSTALALFPYEPSIGAIVDLRNITVGGN